MRYIRKYNEGQLNKQGLKISDLAELFTEWTDDVDGVSYKDYDTYDDKKSIRDSHSEDMPKFCQFFIDSLSLDLGGDNEMMSFSKKDAEKVLNFYKENGWKFDQFCEFHQLEWELYLNTSEYCISILIWNKKDSGKRQEY
jgi:hypothetical protein